MQRRTATQDDVAEIVRLARVMYESLGLPSTDPAWVAAAERAVRRRLGDDLMAVVVDDPVRPGGLVASGVGTIASRMPNPVDHRGRVGYIQWVATDPDQRRRGFGGQVIDGLLAWYEAQGVLVVELHASADGEPTYRRRGFTDEGPIALRRRSPTVH